MRRGVGVKHIKRKEKETEAFTTLGKELQEENIQHVAGLMTTFKESLEEFARKHKKDINANPVLRAEVRWSVRVWEDRGRGGEAGVGRRASFSVLCAFARQHTRQFTGC